MNSWSFFVYPHPFYLLICIYVNPGVLSLLPFWFSFSSQCGSVSEQLVVLSCLLEFNHDIYHITIHWAKKHCFLICLSLRSDGVICCPLVLKWEERVINWLKFLSFFWRLSTYIVRLYGRLCRIILGSSLFSWNSCSSTKSIWLWGISTKHYRYGYPVKLVMA